MTTELSVEDRKEAKGFIVAVEKLGLPWSLMYGDDYIRTPDFLEGGPAALCLITARYAAEERVVVNPRTASMHYEREGIVTDIVARQIMKATDNNEGCDPELRQLMLGLLPQAA